MVPMTQNEVQEVTIAIPGGRQSAAPGMRAFLLAALVVVLTTAMPAQTIRPLLVEHTGEARGHIELENNTMTALNVVLEAKSFQVDENGGISYGPLDPQIKLKLSAMSFRIAPQQTYHIFYEAKAEKLPAWFVIYAAFGGVPVRELTGINVQIELPHTVYILPKQALKKEEVAVKVAEFDAAKRVVRLDVQNNSAVFGRVMSSELVAGSTRQSANGFPLFPGKNRRIEMAWEGNAPPDKIFLNFQRFRLEQKLAVKSD